MAESKDLNETAAGTIEEEGEKMPEPQPEALDPVAGEDPVDDGSGDEVDEAAAPSLADLQAQVEALTRDKSALYDQLLRRQAEFDNYRKRVERERGEMMMRARSDVLLALLPVIDNFERALSSFEAGAADADALRHGVELIHKQLKDALTKMGVEEVEALGQRFDPNLHEAVTIEVSDEHEENTVIEELERGYKFGDRLLRPAKVKVASR